MKKLIQIFILFLSTITLFSQNTNCDPPVITDISPISPCLYAGDTMYFSSITTNADSYLWTFGNGDTTTHQEGEIVFENEGYYCVTLEVFNVCGTKHYSEVVYVLPNECACPQNMAYDIHDTIYTTNQTWNLGNFPSGEVIVDGDIFIQQGANMFIEDLTIRFSPRGKIIVDTAATLTIDNSTLTNLGGNCDYMWQGIEVRGTNMMGSNELFQGVIKIDTAVTIENAHIGVLLGERNMDYICDNNNSWGEFYTASAGGLIIMGDDTGERKYFINNGIGIKFLPRHPSLMDASGNHIFGIDFTCGTLLDPHYNTTHSNPYPNNQNPWAAYANPDQRTSIGIDIENQKGFDIVSCNFNNMDTCIKAFNTKFNVYGYPNSISMFTNSGTGIYISNPLSSIDIDHEIYNCEFKSIDNTAIFIRAGEFDKIYNNMIGFQYASSFPDITTGINLSVSSNHEVYENEFNKCAVGIIANNNNTGFIGAKAPEYNGNKFSSCRTSIITAFDNTNLTLKCNQHWPDAFGAIPYDDNWKNFGFDINGTLLSLGNQGQPPFTCFDTRCPAGNRFHILLKKDIQSNQDYFYWRHISTPTNFPELRPVESLNNNPNTIHINNTFQQWQGQTISCQPVINIQPVNPLPPLSFNVPPYSKIDSLKSIKDSLIAVKSNIEANLDGGETGLLLDAINSNMPRFLITGMLVSHSPLSDTVLIAALTREQGFGRLMFTLIMMNNLPVSYKVAHYFNQRLESLPFVFKNLLLYLQAYPVVETPELIDNKISEQERLKLDLSTRLVNYLCDTMHNRKEDALLLLEHEGSLNSLQTLAASYIELKDFAKASAMLAQIPLNNEANIDFVNLHQILLNLYQQGKTLYQLDSVDKEYIRTLAYKCPPTRAVANARAITELLFGQRVPECPYDIGTKNMMTADNIVFDDYYFANEEEESMLGENYPDPFGVSTKIPYKLPDGINASIVIHDVLGRIVKIYENLNGENEIELKTESWASGTYVYSLIIENIVFESKKMVK